MKKRLIGTLLLGALMVSSTSMFTSCKDYDDDINNIVATKADKTELQEVKNSLENQISGLKEQLTTVNGQITTLTNNKADKFNVDGETYNLETVWNQLFPLIEKEANLRTRIGEAEEAIDLLEDMIGSKVSQSEYFKDCKNYYEALEKTWAKVASVDSELGKALQRIEGLENAINDEKTGLMAVYNDLQGQIKALGALTDRVQTIENDYLKQADKDELLKKIKDEKEALEKKVNDLETALRTAIDEAEARAKADAKDKADAAQAEAIRQSKEYTNQELGKMGLRVDSLANVTKGLSDRIDKNFALINILNVYVRQALRGLVFSMDTYYACIEATDLTVLWYKKYTLNEAKADEIELYGYAGPREGWNNPQDEPMSADNYLERLNAHKHVDLDFTTRYAATSESYSKVLKFQAKYYMDPSSAAISDAAGTVKVWAFDKPYHLAIDTIVEDGDVEIVLPKSEFNGLETEYGAGLKVVNWKTENGMLIVDLDCTNPNKIRSILNDNAVTVFAANVNDSITSDFAALYKQDVKDLRISHTPQTANGYANHNGALIHNGQRFGSHKAEQVNKHCGYCSYKGDNQLAEYQSGLHLMQTVAEAAGTSGVTGNGTAAAVVDKFKDSPAGGFDCQDSVGYKDTLDLMKLVEVHYTVYDANGENATHTKMSADMIKAAGLKFRFALTGLFYGTNQTSESAHAAIKHEVAKDGSDSIWWLRPQMPDSIIKDGVKEGVAVAWNATKKGTLVGTQARQTIGRTPLVRVELYMPGDDGKDVVVDYGYIRIKIVEHPKQIDEYVEPIYMVEYNTPGMTASQDFCAALGGKGMEFVQRWIEMEYDIMADIDITQPEFESNYIYDGDGEIFNQFYLKKVGNGYVPTAVTHDGSATDELGQIRIRRNWEDEQTSVVEWKVSDAELTAYANKLGGDASKANLVRVARFQKRGNSALPAPQYPTYIYVAFIPAGLTISAEPTVSGVLNWENEFNRRNTSNWYAKNANPDPVTRVVTPGLVEIHAQTLSPEDTSAKEEWTGQADSLTTHLPDVFTKASNAAGVPNKLITPTNDAYDKFITINGADIKGSSLKLDLVFVDSTYKDQKFKANNGKSYKLEVINKGKALGAYESTYTSWKDTPADKRDTVAIMYFDQDEACAAKDSINHWQVGYRNNYVADALLNYAAHDELANDIVKAVVGVKATYATCNVPLSQNTFDIRFLRPINVKNSDKTVGDAADNGKQIIYLRDCVSFTDWRDVPFKTDYWYYYGIQFIEIADVAEGHFLAENAEVMTDLDAEGNVSTKAPLVDKNPLLDLVYEYKPVDPVEGPGEEDDFGYITYSNFSNTTQEFHLWLPIKVTYIWGDIYTTVQVTVKATQGNGGTGTNGSRQAK